MSTSNTSNSSSHPQPTVTCSLLCLSSSDRGGVNQGAAWIPNRSHLVAASCFSRGKVVFGFSCFSRSDWCCIIFIKPRKKGLNFGRSVKNKNKLEKALEGMAVVIGGMVLDIHATPSIRLSNPRGTTTPGKVDYMLGGVARNIAECMSKLRPKPFIISALGLDNAGNLLLEHWRSLGLPVQGIRQGLDITTATVSNMFDIDGELVAGVASVESIERYLTPNWIQQFSSIISAAPVLMIDANLSSDALMVSCQTAADAGVPVWFEPVSVAKSRRVAAVAKYVTFASPNETELLAMANAVTGGNGVLPVRRNLDNAKFSIETLFGTLKPAISVLLERGIKFVIVTLGSDGVFLCSRGGPRCLNETLNGAQSLGMEEELYSTVMMSCPPDDYSRSTSFKGSSHLFVVHFPALPATVARVSGAGDCLVGGILSALCSGLNVKQSMAVGVAAAKASVQAEANVPTMFDLAAMAGDAGVVYSSAKVIFQTSAL
ncbi:hypothetical protein Droror1_Dr00006580 [Drosera rotundifolia]